jgi:hypothetical protein
VPGVQLVAVVEVDALMQEGAAPITAEAAGALSSAALAVRSDSPCWGEGVGLRGPHATEAR